MARPIFERVRFLFPRYFCPRLKFSPHPADFYSESASVKAKGKSRGASGCSPGKARELSPGFAPIRSGKEEAHEAVFLPLDRNQIPVEDRPVI